MQGCGILGVGFKVLHDLFVERLFFRIFFQNACLFSKKLWNSIILSYSHDKRMVVELMNA